MMEYLQACLHMIVTLKFHECYTLRFGWIVFVSQSSYRNGLNGCKVLENRFGVGGEREVACHNTKIS
jgi:hypothetical protein